MDGSNDAYQYLIQRISAVLPDIAVQIREEVGRGRVVLGSKLPTTDRHVRETRMEQANVGRIGKSDVVSVEYTDDEKLALLIDAVLCLAGTMLTSREAVAHLGDHLDAPLVFEAPDGSDRAEITLDQDIGSLSEKVEMVNRLLVPALEELGRVP
jgi:hypothetical protein